MAYHYMGLVVPTAALLEVYMRGESTMTAWRRAQTYGYGEQVDRPTAGLTYDQTLRARNIMDEQEAAALFHALMLPVSTAFMAQCARSLLLPIFWLFRWFGYCG